MVQDYVHDERRSPSRTLDVLLHYVRDVVQSRTCVGVVLADGDQKVGSDEHIDLIDRELLVGVVEGVEDDKGVSGKVLDLGT